MKRFYRFILFVNIVIILVFCVLFFRNEISAFIYSQTGITFTIPQPNMDWVAFWKKDDENSSAGFAEVENSDEGEKNEGQKQGKEVFDSRIEDLEDNTVIGINYSGIGDDPQSLATHADKIVKAKVKSVKVTAYDNFVHSEIIARVKKTYKGQESEEIRIFAFGGKLNTSELKDGQVKEAAGKTNQSGDTVNVLMDFCEPIKEGEEYIIFAVNNNGILSPVNGNMSFFMVDGRKVVRLSSENTEFSMKLGDFEKEYLE